MASTRNSSRRPVLVAGSLDTKGDEILFLKQQLAAASVPVQVADFGVLGTGKFTADVTSAQIAEAAGESIDALRQAGDRGQAMAAMQRGLSAWVRAQRDSGDCPAAMLAIGGSAGTAIATAAMRELPIGVPKVMVSTMASGDVRPYVGTVDICMMYSVADFTGLNRLTETILRNAAGAIAGMYHALIESPTAERETTLLGATMFGVTTPCVNRVKELVEKTGYELLVFHATGTGGQAMERLVQDGFIQGVLDITTTELADELVGGVLTAGPDRLEAAGKKGVPQVISVGAIDMVNFGPPSTVPAQFRDRLFYPHNAAVTLMRTTPEENEILGRTIARKANLATGPVTIVLPLRGVSAIDAEGKAFHDPAADQRLFAAIRAHLKPHVRLVELDLHINDLRFADALAAEFLSFASERVPTPAIHAGV